ncbi:MAG: MoaD/ThiS family protein [Candidatus Micrarchaeia archaeon]
MKYVINGKSNNIRFEGTVQELLSKLGISEQIVIVKVNGKIVTELDKVSNQDNVEIQKVILGG